MNRSYALQVLQEALQDTAAEVWSSSELEFLLDSALAQVNQMRPRSVRDEIELEEGTDLYELENVVTVTQVDWIDSQGRLVHRIPPQAWEVWGINDLDELVSTGDNQQLWLNPRWAREGYSIRVHGYGPWIWDDVEVGEVENPDPEEDPEV